MPPSKHATGTRLRVAGFFAGVGGIELGLRQAGHVPLWFCENEPAACAVLRRHFKGATFAADIRDVDELPGGVDVLAAGFPCQDLSSVGPALGIDGGSKSTLVRHVFSLLGPTPRVPWILFENVPFMLRLDGGRAMGFLVQQLERRGYRWAYRVVDARAFGLPQRRQRVFLVASIEGDPRSVLFADEAGSPGPERVVPPDWTKAHGFYWTEGNRGVGWAIDAVPTLKGGSALGIPSPPAIVMPDGEIVTPHICDAERLQGFPAGWTATGGDARQERQRWRMVGNAVSVATARWIGKRMSSPGTPCDLAEAPLGRGDPWPSAAYGGGGGKRVSVLASTWPTCDYRQPLHEFLEHPTTPLSLRATRGFRQRYERSALRQIDGLLERLFAHERRAEREAGGLARLRSGTWATGRTAAG